MATKAVKCTIGNRDQKGKVVKFSDERGENAIDTVYLRNAEDKKLGSPEAITLTITASEE